jgi:maltose O-acetyltransferase
LESVGHQSGHPDLTAGTRDIRALFARARAEPGRAFAAVWALAKGYLYKAYYRVRGQRFRAGRGLRVYGRLSVRGPGEVILGDLTVIEGRVTLWTHAPEAQIIVGDHVMFAGTAFSCAREIRIDRRCIVARAQIRDTDFHALSADRWSLSAPVRVAPVHLRENVWIADRVGILPGTQIGENSVVGFAAVCYREYPANVVIVGNPAKVASPIPAPRS